MTKAKFDAWLKGGKYLPPFMRDFHDQKDLFKTIHETYNMENPYLKTVTWVIGHCYVIDIFLWCMAKHGYTLQKSQADLPFLDIQDTLALAKEKRDASFRDFFKQINEKNNGQEKQP